MEVKSAENWRETQISRGDRRHRYTFPLKLRTRMQIKGPHGPFRLTIYADLRHAFVIPLFRSAARSSFVRGRLVRSLLDLFRSRSPCRLVTLRHSSSPIHREIHLKKKVIMICCAHCQKFYMKNIQGKKFPCDLHQTSLKSPIN